MLTHILKKRVCVISTVVEISQISFLRCFDFAQHDICSLGSTAILFLYEFDEILLNDGNLNVLIFEEPTAEWAEFIFKNRNRDSRFIHDYDIVIGPIADDGVAYLLGRYEEGTLTIEELGRELAYKKLNNQYFFATDKSIKFLKKISFHE